MLAVYPFSFLDIDKALNNAGRSYLVALVMALEFADQTISFVDIDKAFDCADCQFENQ